MNRDRTPSAGGWSITSAGHAHRPSGARSSIGIAPDQQFPDVGVTTNGQYVDLSKPFWAQESDQSEPPPKKQKRSAPEESPNMSDAPPVQVDEESLGP